MIEPDTIKLLRECDAGIKMGVASIEEVFDYVKDPKLKETLSRCKENHEKLKEKVNSLLGEYDDEGKEPNLMAKGMSLIKTNVKLTLDSSDSTVADLMTDGCNMGVKSLSRYLNQYQAADETSKNIAKDLIAEEENLTEYLKSFL